MAKGITKTVEKLPLAQLVPYANNPRENDNAVPYVKESIRQVGYIAPIIIDEDNVLLAGHTRLKALTESGAKEIEVLRVTGLSEEQKKKFRIYDNKTGELASWNNYLLKQELAGIDFDGFDFGQPEISFAGDGEEEKHKPVVCPCCGEVVVP